MSDLDLDLAKKKKPDDSKIAKDGEVVKRQFVFFDNAGRSSPTFDAAGPSRLADAGSEITDSLAAAPVETAELQYKVHRAIADARAARDDTAFGSAVDTLRSMAARYASHGFGLTDAAAKAACTRASSAVSGTAEALAASRKVEQEHRR